MDEKLTDEEWTQLIYLKPKADEALYHLQRMDEYNMALRTYNSIKAGIDTKYDLHTTDTINDGVIHRGTLRVVRDAEAAASEADRA